MQVSRRGMFGAIILAVLLAVVWIRPLDALAEQYTESGLKRASVTFAAARAMNATISVLQSASVNFQIGAGASLQLGAVLDPLDDLVEQFSALMLAATLSFATQRLLIEVSGAWPVSLLLTVLLLAWGTFNVRSSTPPEWLPKLALGLLCLSLAVPAVALGSEVTYQLLLKDKFENSQSKLTSDAAPDAEAKVGESLTDRMNRWWAQNTDIREKIEKLRTKADGWVEHIVRLAAVFLVQTIVLPLLFLWAVLKIYGVLSAPFNVNGRRGRTKPPLPQLPNEA